MNKSSILCVGELLIDFFCADIDTDLAHGQHFSKQAGGAPANVCATITVLGGRARFLSKVGNDPFGYFLKETMRDLTIDHSSILVDQHHPTTLAFVSLKEGGERDFVFNRGADAHLNREELHESSWRESSIIHFGSATALLDDPFKSAYQAFIQTVKEAGKFVSFDPNFRSDLWKGRERDFIEMAEHCIGQADFVKVSEEECKIISGCSHLSDGVNYFHRLGASAVAVTLGKNGTLVSNGKESSTVPSILVHSVDSTGAGDAFVGATLHHLNQYQDPKALLENFEELKNVISIANRVGATVCTKIGAISAIRELGEEVFL
ncbi:carbohydrate kinase family protein [Rossellomorea vietnamensis]|uniref:Sugar kinase n=1 Tax=Rossellomorea vietnamensis TaxID=218284 RepID=A0A0P6VUQ7_9BACI|nr:carbohydrate kinase [Rossellomorea vietnamensis]KPL58340.1 sugar kinase [Rossellomorea vietnamensis]